MNRPAVVVQVGDGSDVATVRRAALNCAEALKMGETAGARVALVTTELATNLVKHTGGGTILVIADETNGPAISLVSIDKGRGIENINAAMRDGYSTAGSPGTGLGAIVRSSTSIDVYSVIEKGTAIVCRIEDDRARPPAAGALAPPSRLLVEGICAAKPGETDSGDAWYAVTGRDEITVLVADGLGHGHAASIASVAAVRVLREKSAQELPRIVEDMHGALRPTRGAAVGIARIFLSQRRLDFAGIGNIAGTIAGEESARKVVSLNGIVGHEMRKVQTFSYPWAAESVLILHSDGLGTSWNLAHYPGLLQHTPMLIAAVLFRDFARGTDDATVVVAKAS